ncbi:MAG: hypothetical protein WBB27_09050 [Maribacter sp.]
MKVRIRLLLPILFVVGILLAGTNGPSISEYAVMAIEDTGKLNSDEDFNKMMDVITHQRCMNCHPNDNIPKQGDTSHPHYFDMARGTDDMGFQATKCTTCHQSENNDYSGVPGAPHWSLAPASMGWQGVSRTEIAKQILDKETNGGKNHEELIKHMTEDELVLWAWEPGVDANGKKRTPPPVSKEDFKTAVENWFKDGALIPSE